MSRSMTILLSVSLTACASTPAGTIDPGIGRRIATVLQVGDAASFGPWQDNDCRRDAGSAARDAQRYASLQYFSGRHAHVRIVPVDDDQAIAVGDQVVVKIHTCKAPLSRD